MREKKNKVVKDIDPALTFSIKGSSNNKCIQNVEVKISIIKELLSLALSGMSNKSTATK